MQVDKYRIQRMFLHQKRYKAHTLNEDIFYFSVCEALKGWNSGSDFDVTLPMPLNFGFQLPSFNFNKMLLTLMSLCKKFLRYMYFTAVAI